MVDEKEVLKKAYNEELEDLEEKIELKAMEINNIDFQGSLSFKEWDKKKRELSKLVNDSKELWVKWDFMKEQLEKLDQTTLDVEDDEETIGGDY